MKVCKAMESDPDSKKLGRAIILSSPAQVYLNKAFAADKAVDQYMESLEPAAATAADELERLRLRNVAARGASSSWRARGAKQS